MKRRYIFIPLVSLLIVSLAGGIYFKAAEASSYGQSAKLYQRLRVQLSYLSRRFRGNYSIVIRDLRRPSLEVVHNDNELFPAASLIKLPILAVSMNAVREGKVKLNDVIVIRRGDIAGGSGLLKRLRLPISITFKKLLYLMITESDNTAANKVIDILGYDYINGVFKGLGLNKTALVRPMMDFSQRKKGFDNFTTTYEIASLLEKIYSFNLIDKKSSMFMLALLKRQTMKDRIPRYLPYGVIVAHKTGLERGVVHDAGIIFSGRGDFIICVLTKDVRNYGKAKKFIAYISYAVYKLYRQSS